MILKILVFSLLCILLFPENTNAYEQDERYKKTVINELNENGVIRNWVVFGPFSRKIINVPGKDDSSSIPIEKYDNLYHDFLRRLKGESKIIVKTRGTLYINDATGKKQVVKARKVTVDSIGFIAVDTLFTKLNDEICYAYCAIESFIPCNVRCFWGVDGDARIWVNGKEQKDYWDGSDSCHTLAKYFDTEFIQGLNPIIIKFTDRKERNRFTFSVYDIKDSLVPFQEKIHFVNLKTSKSQLPKNIDSLSVNIQFDVPIPENLFYSTITVISDLKTTGVQNNIYSLNKTVNKPFLLHIPDSLEGDVRIKISCDLGNERVLETESHIWRGDFKTAINTQRKRFKIILKNIHNTNFNNSFIKLMCDGMVQWGSEWFNTLEFLSYNEQVRQLGCIKLAGNTIDRLIADCQLTGNHSFPLLIARNKENLKTNKNNYEPSHWLNYKYPDKYKLPHSEKNSDTYPFWIYLPKTIKKKRKKIPLIISLHDAAYRGYGLYAIKEKGPIAYADKTKDFPFAIVTPLCRTNSLWHTSAIKSLLDTLISTGRFDKNRIFIIGSGMGGFTAWHLASKYPDYFKAIIPINSGGEKDDVCGAKNVAVWAIHGGKNKIVPLEIPQSLVASFQECAKKSKEFSVYAQSNHYNLAPLIYKDERIYNWLQKQ